MVVLIGCDGDDSADTSRTDFEGRFIDAPVEGLSYTRSDGRTATTTSRGSFEYSANEAIHFHIGALTLGTATAGKLMTPVDLVADAASMPDPTLHPTVVNIARFLQNLDEDLDPTNGIRIPLFLNASLTPDLEFELAKNPDFESDLIQALDLLFESRLTSGQRRLIGHLEAQQHLRESLTTLADLRLPPTELVVSKPILAEEGIGLPIKAKFKTTRHVHLHRSMQKLRAGAVLTVVALGDSIMNDTFRSFSPDEKHGLELVEPHFGASINLIRSIRSSTGAWWYKDDGRVWPWVLDHRPDLVFIGGISHHDDIDSVRELVQQIQAADSEVEIVLMTGAVALDSVPIESSLSLDINDGSFRSQLYLLADELQTAFIDMRGSYNEFVIDANHYNPLIDHAFFQRDHIHANPTGHKVLRQIVTTFFVSPAAGR